MPFFFAWTFVANGQPLFREGVLMVKIRPLPAPLDKTEEMIQSIAGILEAADVQSFSVVRASALNSVRLERYLKVSFPPPEEKKVYQRLESSVLVERVEPVPLFYCFFHPPFGNPDDYSPAYSKHLALVNITEAWQYNYGHPEVTIAVVDNGFWLPHEDLRDNVRLNTLEIPNNGVDDDGNGYIDDHQGFDAADGDGDVKPPMDTLRPFFVHGTACASVAAASTHNGKGMAGAGFRCRYLPVKAVSDTIGFAALTHSYEAVEYAIAAGADVISMSFGSSVFSAYFRDLLLTAHDRGIVCVAAAGNADAEAIQYPCGYENVICVSSVDESLQKYSSANYGAWVDVCASGEATAANLIKGYKKRAGTSMACAAVAGVCGLLKSHRPDATPDDVRRAIVESAQSLDELNTGHAGKLGSGLLNAGAAMKKLRPMACRPELVSHLGSMAYILKTGGYFPAGTGPRNIVEKAELFQRLPGRDYVTHIELRPGFLKLSSQNDSVSVHLYAKNTVHRPGQTLFSGSVALKNLKARWDENKNYVISLPAPVKVSDVFASLRLPAAAGDTLALPTSDNTQTYETAWERAYDGTWTAVYLNWGVSLNMGIELRYVSEEALFDPGNVLTFNNENVFTLLYHSPTPEAMLWTVDGKIVGETPNAILGGLEAGRHTYVLYIRRGVCVHEISGTFETTGAVSIDPVVEPRLSAYPNPNGGAFRILGAPPGTLPEVYTMDGRKVAVNAIEYGNEMEIRLFTPGVYVVKTGCGENTRTIKVVVAP